MQAARSARDIKLISLSVIGAIQGANNSKNVYGLGFSVDFTIDFTKISF